MIVSSDRRRLWLAAGVLVAYAGLFAAPAFARSSKLHGTPIPRLKERAQKEGTVMVLVRVRLDEPFVPEGRLKAEGKTKQRKSIRGAQERVVRKHAKLKADEQSYFASIPHLLLRVDAATLEALAADDDVVRIDEEIVMRPLLADSTAQVEAPYLWSSPISATGSGYSVAILDTGVQSNHSFLSSKVALEACFSRTIVQSGQTYFSSTCTGATPDSNGLTSLTGSGSAAPCSSSGVYADTCKHGTAVAGVAAGKNGSYSSLSFDGVAKDAEIVAVKVFTMWNLPGDDEPVALEGDIIRALEYVNNTARTAESVVAVNLSIAGSGTYATSIADRDLCTQSEDGSKGVGQSAIDDVVDSLISNGVVVVGGAGNDRQNKVYFPACVPGILAVGGVTKDDVVWHESSSSGSNSAEAMDLWAPASGYSSGGSGAGAAGIVTSYPTSTYAALKGTSLATPHVAGAVAVLKQATNASAANIIEALKNSGPAITDSTHSVTRRRLDLKRAYFRLTDASAPSAPALTATTTGSTTVLVSWTTSTDAQSGIDYYVVERKASDAAAYAEVHRTTSTSWSDTTRSANSVYQYRVTAVNLANRTATSNSDIAVTKLYSTDLGILASHITDLRAAVNLLCDFAGASKCASHPYDSAALNATNLQNTAISYLRFTDLRTQIDTLRSAVGASAASWDATAPNTGVLLQVKYIDELRNALR